MNNTPLGWLKYAGAAILALGAAVLFRRNPVANPKQDKIEKGPDMKVADDNAVEIDKREEELKVQHAHIEEVLAPKPETPNLPLRDAVDKWNANT